MFILLVVTFIYKMHLNTITSTGNWYNCVIWNLTKITCQFDVFWLLLSTGIWNTPFQCKMTSMDVSNQEMWCMRSMWIHTARPFLDLQPKRSEGPLTFQRNAVGLSATFCLPNIMRSHVKLYALLLFYRKCFHHIFNWHRQWNNTFC